MQNAQQHRAGGTRLKQGANDPYGVTQEEWLQLAGIGRKRSAVAATTLAALNVSLLFPG